MSLYVVVSGNGWSLRDDPDERTPVLEFAGVDLPLTPSQNASIREALPTVLDVNGTLTRP